MLAITPPVGHPAKKVVAGDLDVLEAPPIVRGHVVVVVGVEHGLHAEVTDGMGRDVEAEVSGHVAKRDPHRGTSSSRVRSPTCLAAPMRTGS
jgi:hypothetical protein